MHISVFGLGYVGTVCASCLASDGHQVVGIDVNPIKVDLINRGLPPIIEADVGRKVAQAVREGRLRATSDSRIAVLDSELSMICVGTPSQSNGSLDLSRVRGACEQIGAALREKKSYHVVVVRSTVLPGSMRDVVLPTLETTSGKKAGRDFGLCVNPEFMREGTAVWDFRHPPKTVIGEIDAGVLLGPTIASGAITHALFPKPLLPPLTALADLGLVPFIGSGPGPDGPSRNDT